MEVIFKILISSLIATSVMTLFSYFISASFRELYKEPVLLSYVLNNLNIKVSPQLKIVLGWILHYLIGVIFVICYYILWKYKIVEMNWYTSLVLGAISGIIGIISWFFMFKISNYTPKIDLKGYYLQLLVAHIIFGFVAFAVYQFL